MDLRAAARSIFLETLRRVDLRATLQAQLLVTGTQLHIRHTSYNLACFPSIFVIAVGKAAVPMTESLLEILQPALTPNHKLQGIVVGPTLPATPHPDLILRIGSHPLPDASASLAATEILDLLQQATAETLVFFLISGGASAMVERPLHPNLAASIPAFYQALLHSGLSITEMNTLRKHVSAVKGGRLAVAAGAATQCTLLVSDVPPGQPDVIGSGLTLPDPTTLADCRSLLTRKHLEHLLPPPIVEFLSNPDGPETPKADHPSFARATWHTLLSSEALCASAQEAAQELGFHTEVDLTPDDWPYENAAAYLLQRLDALATAQPQRPVCLVSAGEIAVPVLSTNPGLGGRNQQFALHCASSLAHSPHPVAVLSAGSDGIDGNSPAAGAVVDQTTLARAHALGLHPATALAAFNSFPVFAALGDAINTGPTGNNLRDLRVLLSAPIDPPGSASPASNI